MIGFHVETVVSAIYIPATATSGAKVRVKALDGLNNNGTGEDVPVNPPMNEFDVDSNGAVTPFSGNALRIPNSYKPMKAQPSIICKLVKDVKSVKKR
jgi:hypothetical protein